MRGAQPCWKLAGTGSVGGQALTGIPVVRALRDDPALGGHSAVWPFETGLAAPAPRRHARVVIAEIYPSLVPAPRPRGRSQGLRPGPHLAAHFAARDARGELAALLAGDLSLSKAERRRVEREEGWVLGVGSGIARRAGRTTQTPRISPDYPSPPPRGGEVR